LDQSDLDQTQP